MRMIFICYMWLKIKCKIPLLSYLEDKRKVENLCDLYTIVSAAVFLAKIIGKVDTYG